MVWDWGDVVGFMVEYGKYVAQHPDKLKAQLTTFDFCHLPSQNLKQINSTKYMAKENLHKIKLINDRNQPHRI